MNVTRQKLFCHFNKSVLQCTRGIHCTMATPRNLCCLGCMMIYRIGNGWSIITIAAVYKIDHCYWSGKQNSIFRVDNRYRLSICQCMHGRYRLYIYGRIECWYLLSMYARNILAGWCTDDRYFENQYRPSIPTINVDQASIPTLDIDHRYIDNRCWSRPSLSRRQTLSSPLSTSQTLYERQRNKGSSRIP